MFKVSVLLLIFAFCPHTPCGFVPGSKFFASIRIPQGKSRDQSLKMLEKQQDAMNDTAKYLDAHIDLLLSQASMGQSQEVQYMNQPANNLRSLVNQTQSKLNVVESKTSKEISTLRSHLERVREDFNSLKALVTNISSEIMTMKNTDSENTLQETKPKEDDGPCPKSKGYHQLSDTLCIRQSDKDDIRGWTNGKTACESDGGDLISFNNETEQKQVMRYLNDLGDEAYGRNYNILRSWVGMTKMDGEFIWNSGSTFPGTWTRFGPHDKSFLKCVTMVYDGLDDTLCGYELRFICRIEMAGQEST